jgi:flagellin-specific chaperone FliS
MKKIGLVALFALLLAGCDDGGEKKAQENLRKAEAALEKENFNEAKLQIDSIRILYPKAFEARKQGVKLMQQVDLKEQRKSLIHLVGQLQRYNILGNFLFKKWIKVFQNG